MKYMYLPEKYHLVVGDKFNPFFGMSDVSMRKKFNVTQDDLNKMYGCLKDVKRLKKKSFN
mgnify:CR=1 FL=1